jgi:hypothetical protein
LVISAPLAGVPKGRVGDPRHVALALAWELLTLDPVGVLSLAFFIALSFAYLRAEKLPNAFRPARGALAWRARAPSCLAVRGYADKVSP